MKALVQKYPFLPYVFPFLLFVVLTGITPYIPGKVLYGYPLKTILVTISVILFWPYYAEIKQKAKPLDMFLAFLIGAVVFVVWIFDPAWYPHLGESQSFNPWQEIEIPWAYIWISFRILGASILVAIIEELFWRGFLLRWLIQEDYQSVPLGAFTWRSFWISSILFGVEHHEWLVGIIAGMLYALLLYRTKNLLTCILAHGLTNYMLAMYVLSTGNWYFW